MKKNIWWYFVCQLLFKDVSSVRTQTALVVGRLSWQWPVRKGFTHRLSSLGCSLVEEEGLTSMAFEDSFTSNIMWGLNIAYCCLSWKQKLNQNRVPFSVLMGFSLLRFCIRQEIYQTLFLPGMRKYIWGHYISLGDYANYFISFGMLLKTQVSGKDSAKVVAE